MTYPFALSPSPNSSVMSIYTMRPASPQSSISTIRFAPSPYYEPSFDELSDDDDEEDSSSYWALANLKSPIPSNFKRSTMSSLATSRPVSFSDLWYEGVENTERGYRRGSGCEMPPVQEGEGDLMSIRTIKPVTGDIPPVALLGSSPRTVSRPRRSQSEVGELEKAHKNAAAIYRYRCVNEDDPIICHICQTEVEESGGVGDRQHFLLRNIHALALHLRIHDLEADVDPSPSRSVSPSKNMSCLDSVYRRLLCCDDATGFVH